jgi:hypothetical protein
VTKRGVYHKRTNLGRLSGLMRHSWTKGTIPELNTTLTEESDAVLPSRQVYVVSTLFLLPIYETRNADGIACACLLYSAI